MTGETHLRAQVGLTVDKGVSREESITPVGHAGSPSPGELASRQAAESMKWITGGLKEVVWGFPHPRWRGQVTPHTPQPHSSAHCADTWRTKSDGCACGSRLFAPLLSRPVARPTAEPAQLTRGFQMGWPADLPGVQTVEGQRTHVQKHTLSWVGSCFRGISIRSLQKPPWLGSMLPGTSSSTGAPSGLETTRELSLPLCPANSAREWGLASAPAVGSPSGQSLAWCGS